MRFPGALGALVEKDLRVSWRDPALKATLFMGLVGPLLFLFFLTAAGGPAAAPPCSSSPLVVGVSVFGTNAFGLERRGIALLMSFPVERWRILVGKNLASIPLRLPALLMLAVAGARPARRRAPARGRSPSPLVRPPGLRGRRQLRVDPVPASAAEPGRRPSAARRPRPGRDADVLRAPRRHPAPRRAVPLPRLAAAAARPCRWLWLVTLPLALAGAAAVYAMLLAGAARLLERREPELLERILGEG